MSVPLLFVLLFVLVPLGELALLIEVGARIGALSTLALCLATAVLGGLLVRSQGRAVLDAIRRALDAGRMPVPEAFHGACLLVAGALLLTPGFLTDLLGFALLVPAVRVRLHRLLLRRLEARLATPAAEGGRVIEVRFEPLEGDGRPRDPGEGR